MPSIQHLLHNILLRELYADLPDLDVEDEQYYTERLERLESDAVVLNGRRYWLDEAEAYERWEDVA